MSDFDPDVLRAQLTAVQALSASDRRIVGEVLSDYGREMIDSADRLDRLRGWLDKAKAAQR